MPTHTFFNLPQEKQRRLLQAARDEFSRVPFDKASINQIVHAAGVSRGSFYQYFNSKEDVLQYILTGYREKAMAHARQSLADSGGDLFAMFQEVFDFTVEHAAGEINLDFCRNLFSNQNLVSRVFTAEAPERSGTIMAFVAKEIKPLVDMQALAATTDDDPAQMIGVLWLVTLEALALTFFDTAQRDIVRAQYLRRLQLIQSGFAHPGNT